MSLPRVIADTPLCAAIERLLAGRVEILPWSAAREESRDDVAALYTYGHPLVGAELLERLPRLVTISNYGVGVDHIDLAAAARRSIPVGNTPGILDGATADMAFALLLAAARRIVEGDRYQPVEIPTFISPRTRGGLERGGRKRERFVGLQSIGRAASGA